MAGSATLHATEDQSRPGSSTVLERFTYDDGVVRGFMMASMAWGVVGMLVGVLAALQLADPRFNLGLEWLSFGRIRPLHTNAVIFAFAGNAIFAAVYYSTQRLLKTRMFSDFLSRVHLWGWQAIIVAAAVTLPLGFSQGKEYSELEWPIDIAVVCIWVVFAVNFIGTLLVRRERHLYVAIWFYIATVVAIAVLYIFNNLVMPAGWMRSYSIYAGAQDAFMQWWYGHNAVAFFLTTPFLGLMYYFLPKAAEKTVFSYRLSIVHFWSLVFLYIWAGPHHLHYTALPEWASTLGMLFSVMLWMPSWGGMLNGLLTLRGAWHRVATDPVLKFFVVGITFYGMSTFEGPLLSVKSVNALSHYTDWTIAHVHAGALGWVGFMCFGMFYWLAPRLFQAPIARPSWVGLHFWTATIGILLYIGAIYWAGLSQGLMWRAFDQDGMLQYPDFIETVNVLVPFYWIRVVGGTLYLAGTVLMGVNLVLTWRNRPARYDEPVYDAARACGCSRRCPASCAACTRCASTVRGGSPASAGARPNARSRTSPAASMRSDTSLFRSPIQARSPVNGPRTAHGSSASESQARSRPTRWRSRSRSTADSSPRCRSATGSSSNGARWCLRSRRWRGRGASS